MNEKEKTIADGVHRSEPPPIYLEVTTREGKKQRALLKITPEEVEKLTQSGFLEIDDPERGWIKINAPKHNQKSMRGQINILRSGSALKKSKSVKA